MTCIVDGSGTRLNAGSSQLALKLCNYVSSSSYALTLSLKAPLACDTKSALVPKVKTLKATGTCAAGAECAVVAELESPIDWAIVMKPGAEPQALLATFKSGGSTEAVTVAIGQDINGAAMVASDATKVAATTVSVCASDVTVSAQRLSRVDGCNTADICRGKATDAACVVPVKTGLPITDVTCVDTNCSGKIALSGALACDAASGDATALIVGVKVANTALSNYVSVATLSAPTSSVITDVSGLAAGNARFALSTSSHCASSAVQVSVAKAGTPAASVASVNATNGSVAVTLTAPLDKALDDATLQFTLTQCGVASKAFESRVGDSDSDDAGNSRGNKTSNGSGAGARNATSSLESTQETNLSTGLSGGMIVGIAIGVVALLAFAFECYVHKRRQAPQIVRASSSDATPMAM